MYIYIYIFHTYIFHIYVHIYIIWEQFNLTFHSHTENISATFMSHREKSLFSVVLTSSNFLFRYIFISVFAFLWLKSWVCESVPKHLRITLSDWIKNKDLRRRGQWSSEKEVKRVVLINIINKSRSGEEQEQICETPKSENVPRFRRTETSGRPTVWRGQM